MISFYNGICSAFNCARGFTGGLASAFIGATNVTAGTAKVAIGFVGAAVNTTSFLGHKLGHYLNNDPRRVFTSEEECQQHSASESKYSSDQDERYYGIERDISLISQGFGQMKSGVTEVFSGLSGAYLASFKVYNEICRVLGDELTSSTHNNVFEQTLKIEEAGIELKNLTASAA